MATKDLRVELHRLIDRVDDQFIKAVHGVVKAYIKKDEIIGYELDGTPICSDDFLEQANQAIHQITTEKNGISIEELDKRTKEWLSRTK